MKNKNNPEMLNHCVCVVLSFILSLTLTCSLLFVVLNNTIFNENFFKQQIRESNYVSYKIKELKDVFVSLGLASNFEEEFMISIIDKSYIEKEVDNIIHATYSGIDYQFDDETLKNQLLPQFTQNAIDRGYELTQENETAINYLVDECIKSYKTEIQFSQIDILKTYLSKFHKYVNTALIFVAVLSVISLIFLLILNPRKYNTLKYIDYSIITMSFLLLIPTIIAITSGRIEKLGILNEGLYNLITSYLNNVLIQILTFAIILLILSVVVYIAYFMLRKKYIKRLKHRI